LETFPKPRDWLGTEKQNLTQRKHTFISQKKRTTTQNKHTKLNPGLVASYNIRPGNRGPILVSVLHKSVTYLLTYLDTYPLCVCE